MSNQHQLSEHVADTQWPYDCGSSESQLNKASAIKVDIKHNYLAI